MDTPKTVFILIQRFDALQGVSKKNGTRINNYACIKNETSVYGSTFNLFWFDLYLLYKRYEIPEAQKCQVH